MRIIKIVIMIHEISRSALIAREGGMYGIPKQPGNTLLRFPYQLHTAPSLLHVNTDQLLNLWFRSHNIEDVWQMLHIKFERYKAQKLLENGSEDEIPQESSLNCNIQVDDEAHCEDELHSYGKIPNLPT